MYGYIYKTTNLINGKIYVGQKMSDMFLKEDYLGSGRYLKNAINKYGKENFKVELIEWCETSEIINEREKYWISYFNCRDPKIGYNIAEGGEGGDTWKGLTNEDRLTRSNKRKETFNNNPHNTIKRKCITNGLINMYIPITELSEYLNSGWILGSCHPFPNISAEHKQKISEKHKGRILIHLGDIMKQIYPNELENYLVDGWQLGRSDYIKDLISKANKNREVTEEARKHMSEAHLNSNQKTQKGYKTINNGSEEKHVPEEILNEYLANGWILGRLPITEQHRKNLSKANKGQVPWCKGFKYITNGIEEKRVNPQDIDKYKDLGWWVGRLPLDKR